MFTALLRQVYANRQWLALVDSADAFDPGSVEPETLSRLLWVRCEKFADAFKAVDWIVRDGNLPVVVLDLQLATARQLEKIAATTWYRLQRILEHNHNLLWVLTLPARHGKLARH